MQPSDELSQENLAHIQRLTEVTRVVPPMIPQIRTYNDPFISNFARGGAPRLDAGQPPVPTIPTPVERLPSQVPILDSEILSTIPLPEETFDNFPANDISSSEPTCETSSISPSAEIVVKKTPSKIFLKYSYKDDQWSPLNPEGKKHYDRNFLLQLQGQPMSLCKPNNLPNLVVIKDKAHIQRLKEITSVIPPMIPQIRTYNDPFISNFARGAAPRLEREKLKRSVQGILNKLTPQKFETLLTQLKNLNIDTEEKLKEVIDLIHKQVIDELNFHVPYPVSYVVAYANLCRHLALIKVPICDKPGQQVNFRKLLLTKCQKEFEQDRINDIKHDERMKAMEEAEPEKRKEMKLAFDEEEKKMRYRQLGNIRFIGELFKLGMLIEPIMHECIKKLLSQGDEESLECLCRLLKTIGKELDEGKSSKNSREQNSMDLYFGQMLKFVDKRLTSSRVRFMLQDVIDLKKAHIQGLTEVTRVVLPMIPQIRTYNDPFISNFARGGTPRLDAPVSPVQPPVPSIPTPVERLPSLVPILDSEILITIPLPEETFDNFPANDISSSEPTRETSSISPSAEIVVKKTPNKIFFKYSYKEDQWSPLNPEGKKHYDRNFLLQLQGQPMSLCKPNNLPNLDVIKDKAHIQRLKEITSVIPPMIPQIRTYNDPFISNFARGAALKLEREKLKRSVQGILNKLTPQKFETLLTQLKNLNIDTEEKLKVVIDLIHKQVIDELNFLVPYPVSYVVAYANLCKHLALIKVPICDKPGQQVNFRKLLLTKCQKEFEQDRINDIKHDERMKAMEEAEPEKRKEMKLEFDEEEKKMRYRQLGNIRFIGELFKLGMLIEPIMHECIKKLLSQGDEESLECLCRLLKTIGKELDEGKSSKNSREQNSMDLYFGQMLKFVDKRLTSSRVRFMLQDVIDLKKAHIQRLTEVTRVVLPMIPQIRTYNDPFISNFARGGAPRLDAPVSPVQPPVPSIPTPVERLPSLVPILDSEILITIPLPEETFDNFPANDISSSEPTRETSSISPSAEIVVKKTPNKIFFKYSYKEDQWSPPNPEGKKHYDRNFLLQLQGQPMSLCKPNNLPNLDVIKDKAHIQRLKEITSVIPPMIPQIRTYNDPFISNFARGAALKLEREKLKRSVQGILNKLTPQKFETLLTQLKNLNIDTEEKLKEVIDLIHKQVIDELNFHVPYPVSYVVAYANLCRHLALIKVPICDKPGQQVNFRKLLLTKCQTEFEEDRINDIKYDERMKAMEEAEPEKRKEMKLEFDEEEKKMRYRQLGNIRFIGELFKLGMLIERIMHECIKKLLSQGDEESLECLCLLLKTIGKELDEGKSSKNSREQNPMDLYFGQMLKFVDKRLTSSRVRFMLQDVIDLKKNNWVSRRDGNTPKRANSCYSQSEPTKCKSVQPDEVISIRLGPDGRIPQSWGRGSSDGTKRPTEDVKATLTASRYCALSEQSLTSSNYEGQRGSQSSATSSRESSLGCSHQLPTAARETPSTSKEGGELIETAKGFTRTSETKVQDTKNNLDVHLSGKAPDSNELCLRGPGYSDDEMERKAKSLIDKFLHNNDYEEAIECATELASPSRVHIFITAAINQVLERSSQARYFLGKLLYSLLKKKILSFEQYKNGCGSFLHVLDNYAFPLIWDYIGDILEPMIEEILEPMIEEREFPFTFLKEVLQPCLPYEPAGLLISAIFHTAAKRKGIIKLGEFWREPGMQWEDFLRGDTNVNDFIQMLKLEFTISPTKVKPNVQMSIDEVQKILLSLLENDIKSEELFEWIDANVSENTEPNFIRALVSTVHENVISGSGERCKLDGEKLKTRTRLLIRYIGHNEKLELQALYAIQFLMNQLGQPNGLLHKIFNILYDDDVITEETFETWKSSDDPNEQEGKSVAVHSVKSFFTWLREADSGDEEADE